MPDPDLRAYAYVPLPEKVKTVDVLPAQDRYHSDRLTGHVDLTVEARSPVYVGPMAPRSEMEASTEDVTRTSDLPYHQEPYRDESSGHPVLPGSTWRGAISGVFTLASYSRMGEVSEDPQWYRTVANGTHVLKTLYSDILGSGETVRAGYLDRRKDGWWIRPARSVKKVGADWSPYRVGGNRIHWAKPKGTYVGVMVHSNQRALLATTLASRRSVPSVVCLAFAIRAIRRRRFP